MINKARLRVKIEHIIAEGVMNGEEIDVTAVKVMNLIEPITYLANNSRSQFNDWLDKATEFYIGEAINDDQFKVRVFVAIDKDNKEHFFKKWLVKTPFRFLNKKGELVYPIEDSPRISEKSKKKFKESIRFDSKEEALDFAKKHLTFYKPDIDIDGFEIK
jgi:hypothetical protein